MARALCNVIALLAGLGALSACSAGDFAETPPLMPMSELLAQLPQDEPPPDDALDARAEALRARAEAIRAISPDEAAQ